MQTKKPLYGILVERGEIHEGLFTETNKEDMYDIKYLIKTTQAPKNKLAKNQWFVTNRAINEKVTNYIETHPVESPNITSYGKITVSVYPDIKLVRTEEYHPRGSGYFIKIGLATLAELIVEKDLFRNLPNYKISTMARPSEQRGEQIKKRGRKVGKAIPLAKAFELTRRQVIKQYRKNKPQNEVLNTLQKFNLPDTIKNKKLYEEGFLAEQIKNRGRIQRVFDKTRLRAKLYLANK